MKDWLDDNLLIILIVGIVLSLLICMPLGLFIWDRAECNAKTVQIGFAHRWSVLGGCQIEVTEGQWIPLGSYYFKQE